MNDVELLELADAFRVAYNEMDITAIERLVAEDISWGHQNRFRGSGRADLIQSLHRFAQKMPGRYFDRPVRFAVRGDTVFREHQWHAVPVESDPAWGWEKGVPTSMTTCSILVFAGGQIVEWTDFG